MNHWEVLAAIAGVLGVAYSIFTYGQKPVCHADEVAISTRLTGAWYCGRLP